MSALIQRSRMRLETAQLADRAANEDFRTVVLKALGDLSDFHVLGTDVLVATYIAPRKTAGGIILTERGVDEDRWQGKVGLVLKVGPMVGDEKSREWSGNEPIREGEWVVIRPSDGWQHTLNECDCRMVRDTDIKMRVASPDVIW